MRVEVVDGQEGWPLVEALDSEVYPPDVMARVVWRDVTWAHADKRIIVHDDMGIRCHVGLFWRIGLLNGSPVQMAGIGGVMTSPAVRRQGYATAALKWAESLMAQRGIDFGLLFCEPDNEHFYANLGWTQFDGMVWAEQPNGTAPFDLMGAMCLAVRQSTVPAGIIDLCGLPW